MPNTSTQQLERVDSTPLYHFEVCGDQLEEIIQAVLNGATRIELCGDLGVGGITPDTDLYKRVRQRLAEEKSSHIPIFVMIRPRSGDFVYNEEEFGTALLQAHQFTQLGADGLVFGTLDSNGLINTNQLEQFLDAIPSRIPVTFHRAIDEAKDCETALQTLLEVAQLRKKTKADAANICRVLSSGGMSTAEEGVEALARMVQAARPHLTVMPGCGINENNISCLLSLTQAQEVHGSFRGCVKECFALALRVWQNGKYE